MVATSGPMPVHPCIVETPDACRTPETRTPQAPQSSPSKRNLRQVQRLADAAKAMENHMASYKKVLDKVEAKKDALQQKLQGLLAAAEHKELLVHCLKMFAAERDRFLDGGEEASEVGGRIHEASSVLRAAAEAESVRVCELMVEAEGIEKACQEATVESAALQDRIKPLKYNTACLTDSFDWY